MHYRVRCLKTYTAAFTTGLNIPYNLKSHYFGLNGEWYTDIHVYVYFYFFQGWGLNSGPRMGNGIYDIIISTFR